MRDLREAIIKASMKCHIIIYDRRSLALIFVVLLVDSYANEVHPVDVHKKSYSLSNDG